MNQSAPSKVSIRLPWWCGAVSLILVALFWPSIRGHTTLSSADLLAHQLPWSTDSSLAGVQPEGSNSDPVYYFDPWFRDSAEAVRAGQFPHRNPRSSLGAPFLGNAQSALLSPFTLPYYLFDEATASWMSALAKLLVAFFATAFLARVLGIGAVGAAFAGLVYALSGFLILWLRYPLASALAVLPLCLLGVRCLSFAPRRGALCLAVGIATAILGGHPECAFQVGFVTLLFFVAEWWRTGRSFSLLRRFALAGGAGVLLAAPQILPFLEYLNSSFALKARSDPRLRTMRIAHPPELESFWVLVWMPGILWMAWKVLRKAFPKDGTWAGSRGIQHPTALVRHGDLVLALLAGGFLALFFHAALRAGAWNGFPLLVEPNYYGISDTAPAPHRYSGPVNHIELNGGYVGAAALLLALLSPALVPRRGSSFRFCYFGLVLCVFVSFDVAPFSQLLFQVPPFDITVNRRFLGVAALFGALLAGWSLHGLISHHVRARSVLTAGVALGTTILTTWLAFDGQRVPDHRGIEVPELVPPVLGTSTAHLVHPKGRSLVWGEQVWAEGYALAVDPLKRVVVRAVSRVDGSRAEVEASVGRVSPQPSNPTLRQYPNAPTSGFATHLPLDGFPGGDIDLWVLRVQDGDEQILMRRRFRLVRPSGLGRGWWTIPLSLVGLMIALGNTRRRRWIGAGVLVLGTAADLTTFADSNLPQISPTHHFPEFDGLEHCRGANHHRLISGGNVLSPNTHLAYGLSSVLGQDVITGEGLRELMDQTRHPMPSTPLERAAGFRFDNVMYPLLGADRLIVPASIPVGANEGEVLFRGNGYQVVEPSRKGVRARFYTNFLRRSADQRPLDVLLSANQDCMELLVLDNPEENGASSGQAKGSEDSSIAAELLQDDPNEIRVRIPPGPAGYLLITDLYSPHFEASVDGAATNVEPAFGSLLAVEISTPSDQPRSVVVRYRSSVFQAGLLLAGLGLLILLAVVFARQRNRTNVTGTWSSHQNGN